LGGPGPSSGGIGKIGGTRRNAASYPADIRSSLVRARTIRIQISQIQNSILLFSFQSD
jgi:hypothetical protein